MSGEHAVRRPALVARRGRALLLLAGLALLPARASAQQERLVDFQTWELDPVFEQWRFPTALPEPLRGGSQPDTLFLRGASEWSLPLAAVIPLGDRWTLDASAAYAMGSVRLARYDSVLATDHLTLNGLTDVKLRATGRLRGDNLLLTLGANLPTGTTRLDAEELTALGVLAAPGLRFQTPALGGGFGATTGIVAARQLRGWAWALGASYELRGKYAPIAALSAGAPSTDLDPGDAVHLSLGTDGLVGQNRMSLSVAADLFGRDRLTIGTAGGTRQVVGYRLGPMYSAQWEAELALPGFRDAGVYAVDVYRTPFTRADGSRPRGAYGNELDAGATGHVGLTRAFSLAVGLDGRWHTGLRIDNTLATAAIRAGGVMLGLDYTRGGLTLRPFVHGQTGTIDTGGLRAPGHALAAGLTLATSF